MIYGKMGNSIGAQVQTTWGNVELCLHSTRISRCVSASMAPRCRPFVEVSIVKFICLFIPMTCKVIRTLYFLKVKSCHRMFGFLGNGDIGKKNTSRTHLFPVLLHVYITYVYISWKLWYSDTKLYNTRGQIGHISLTLVQKDQVNRVKKNCSLNVRSE